MARRSVRLAPPTLRRGAGGARRIRPRNPARYIGRNKSRPPYMRSMARRSAACSLTSALASIAIAGTRADAQQPEPIRYVLRMPAPKTHYIEVQTMYPTSRRRAIELMMPVWMPGSYLVREFARYVEEVRARDPAGHALQVVKSRKNRWRVEAERAGAVVLTYRVYAHERQARTNWVEDSLRPDQRCSDLHHPGRARAASSRGRARAARRMVQVADVVADDRQRSATPLSRPRLRHAGRLSDPRG